MLGPIGDQRAAHHRPEPVAKGIIEAAAHAGGDRARSRQAVAADERGARAAERSRRRGRAPPAKRSACASAPGR